MTPAVFKAACDANEVCRLNNLYIFKRSANITNKPEYKDLNIFKNRCHSVAETTEIIKNAITPETFFNAGFHAVETLAAHSHGFLCIAANPVTMKFKTEALNQEFLLCVQPYQRERYTDPEEMDKKFPLIARTDLADPSFMKSAQLSVSIIDGEPAAGFRFKGKRNPDDLEQEFRVEFRSYYPTLQE